MGEHYWMTGVDVLDTKLSKSSKQGQVATTLMKLREKDQRGVTTRQ